MVKLNRIIDFLDSFAPTHLAEDYDNVGLLVGDSEKQIKNVMITLDVDEHVINDACEKGADLIISHHPLIFKPIKRLVSDDSVSKSVMSLIKNDISLISVHTNFDSVKSGLCDLFLDKIANTLNRVSIDGDEENGIGRIADLKKTVSLDKLLSDVKNAFSLNKLQYVGKEDKEISKIAVCNGGGADLIYSAKKMGADCFISGDFKYHHARFAYENNISLIEVNHYDAEIIFTEYLRTILNEQFDSELNFFLTDKNKNIWKSF